MKSLEEYNQKNLAETIGMYLKEDWYFSGWEKFILVGLGILGMWKIWEWIF